MNYEVIKTGRESTDRLRERRAEQERGFEYYFSLSSRKGGAAWFRGLRWGCRQGRGGVFSGGPRRGFARQAVGGSARVLVSVFLARTVTNSLLMYSISSVYHRGVPRPSSHARSGGAVVVMVVVVVVTSCDTEQRSSRESSWVLLREADSLFAFFVWMRWRVRSQCRYQLKPCRPLSTKGTAYNVIIYH